MARLIELLGHRMLIQILANSGVYLGVLAFPLVAGGAVMAPTHAAAAAAAENVAADSDQVVLETGLGVIVVLIDRQRAPVTAANFLRLAADGHYDGATFYRTVTDTNDNGHPRIDVIQGGIGQRDPPFPPIAHEPTGSTGITHTDGTLSMARGEVGTAASEFFICIGDQPGLDQGGQRHEDRQGFAAFGRVVEGMAVVRRIHQLTSNAPAPSDYVTGQYLDEPVVIIKARRR